MRIVVLAGGIGGARFLLGVRALARTVDARVTAVINTGDDITLHGLRVCPDLDSVMYTLGGGADGERGWGRQDETWTVKQELAAYGAEPGWFGLGDRDLATHLVRSQMLAAGYPLSAVTAALCDRWQPGVRLLPATDERLETHVLIADADGQRAVHFQEWWIRYRAAVPAHRFVFVGAEAAKPAPGVLDELAGADVVLLAPSNPVVSIAPVLAVQGLREALAGGTAPVVGVSPIIAGAPVRGMADRCLAAIGVPCTSAGVAGLYGARGTTGAGGPPGLLDAWLADPADGPATDGPAADGPTTEGPATDGPATVHVPLWMRDEEATVAIVRAALAAAGLPV